MGNGFERTARRFVLLCVLTTSGCGDSPTRARLESTAADPTTPASAARGTGDPGDFRELRAAVSAQPEDYSARRRLAIALHEDQQKIESLEHFEKAAELNPDPRSLLDLALAYGSVFRIRDAEATYHRILELDPGHAIALHNLANLAVKQGQMERGIQIYRQAIRVRPDYLMAYYHLGETLERVERNREAYLAYGKVLELEPATAEDLGAFHDALYQMASLDIMMGERERAAEMLQTLLEVDPEHFAAHYAYGRLLLELNRPDEAQREFEAHMKILAKREPTGPVATRE